MAYGVDDAILVASIAASAAGTASSMKGQAEARDSARAARNAELLRQQDYQKRAAQVAAQSVEQSSRPVAEQQLKAGQDTRMQAYDRLTNPVASAGASPVTSPQTVVRSPMATATATNNSLATAWNRILGTAQANLGAYGDWGLQQDIKNRRAAEQLGIISRDARGSASALEGELEDASHAGDGWNMAGALLSTAGNLGGRYRSVASRASTPKVSDGALYEWYSR